MIPTLHPQGYTKVKVLLLPVGVTMRWTSSLSGSLSHTFRWRSHLLQKRIKDVMESCPCAAGLRTQVLELANADNYRFIAALL